MDRALNELREALARIVATDRILNEANYHRENLRYLIQRCYEEGVDQRTLEEEFDSIACEWRT